MIINTIYNPFIILLLALVPILFTKIRKGMGVQQGKEKKEEEREKEGGEETEREKLGKKVI